MLFTLNFSNSSLLDASDLKNMPGSFLGTSSNSLTFFWLSIPLGLQLVPELVSVHPGKTLLKITLVTLVN